MNRNYLGRHFIAEFYKCNPHTINDSRAVESIMTEAAVISGATIIKPFFHTFSPQGVSGIIVIAESHFAIHTWPEHSYAAVDLFSCSDFLYKEALSHIKERFQSVEYSINVINRGITGSPSSQSSDINIIEVRL